MTIQKDKSGVYYYGPYPEENVLNQIKRNFSDERCVYAALMGDNHLGYSTPIGGVVAYKGVINVSGVGYDIGCGNKAVRLNVKGEEIRPKISKIMDNIYSKISFGVGKTSDKSINHCIFDNEIWDKERTKQIDNLIESGKSGIYRSLKEIAKLQLGTIGSGNHFVDIFVDENDDVWIGVHFGSRRMGYKIAQYFIKQIIGKSSDKEKPVLIEEDNPIGKDYIDYMNLAGKYAFAGRNIVCDMVAEIIGADIIEEVHNHHNFAWKEKVHGEICWVTRKGATRSLPGQKSFIGGSMGDNSVIIKGLDTEEAKTALYSTVHGAGRILGRNQAKGKFKNIKDSDGKIIGKRCVKEPKISKEEMNNWIQKFNVELRGGDVDESPHCYKRLNEVLKYHSETIEIIHQLKPIGVAMA